MNFCVTNIQRFSLHDGPGIRTTVFLKGCSIKCPWCANPENINLNPEKYIIGQEEGVYGMQMTVEELFDYLMRDKVFYENGGVTFSGGEPLLQAINLEPLLKKIQDVRIHICIETALFVSEELLDVALNYVDLFYVDIKLMDSTKCKDILGGDLELYKKNVKKIFQANKEVIFRIPVIKGYTFTEENIELIISFIHEMQINKIELIKGHNLGREKAKSIKRKMIDVEDISDTELEILKEKLETSGATVIICEV